MQHHASSPVLRTCWCNTAAAAASRPPVRTAALASTSCCPASVYSFRGQPSPPQITSIHCGASGQPSPAAHHPTHCGASGHPSPVAQHLSPRRLGGHRQILLLASRSFHSFTQRPARPPFLFSSPTSVRATTHAPLRFCPSSEQPVRRLVAPGGDASLQQWRSVAPAPTCSSLRQRSAASASTYSSLRRPLLLPVL